MKINLMVLICSLSMGFSSYAAEKVDSLISFHAGYMDYPENSFSFSLTPNGDFIYMDYTRETKKVGVENSPEDLQKIKETINSLPGSLTSIPLYNEYGCPNDGVIGRGGEVFTVVWGSQFKDGRLDLDDITKECVWKNVDSASKAKIKKLDDYFKRARSIILGVNY